MSPIVVFKYVFATAMLAASAIAPAAYVHTGDSGMMAKWYGRAGGLVGSDVVRELSATQQAGKSVQVNFSPDWAAWTNMPRGEANVGPVTDSFGAVADHGSAMAEAPEEYGRAGDDELLEQMQKPR
jgi:hypothetical protein